MSATFLAGAAQVAPAYLDLDGSLAIAENGSRRLDRAA